MDPTRLILSGGIMRLADQSDHQVVMMINDKGKAQEAPALDIGIDPCGSWLLIFQVFIVWWLVVVRSFEYLGFIEALTRIIRIKQSHWSRD